MNNSAWSIFPMQINDFGLFLPDFRNISFLLIVFAATFLYFGRIIGDTKVEKFDKIEYYITGFCFTIIYVLFPLAITIEIYRFFDFRLSLPFVFVVQFVILLSLLLNFRAHYILRKHGFIEIFKKEIERKISERKRKKSTLGKLMENTNKNLRRIM